MTWEDRLGGGLDRYVWKVWIEEMGPFALKFWDTDPPDFLHYYAAQRECQNAAVLQMMEAAITQAAVESPRSESTRILGPRTRRKCFGWLRLSGDIFRRFPLEMRAPSYKVSKIQRSMSSSRNYIALVYEYVEEGENDEAVVEDVDRFFWLAGFSHTISPSAENWKSGVLVDLADIVYAGGYGWKKQFYRARTADWILIE
ncbi:hypothetical protein F53441_8434 [Fusarium austroafricanum]|uniref:Uncharacterized protein n=1 Tax=Fusarium austroafricanum TaxID=2364996 RepID=A0A8H4KEH4_9HYPO|nr:hypothetical protein F53441_8434 [Fusarium austroafricanum]